MSENELYHYGVKGMRWGVRKARHKERAALNSASKATTNKQRKEGLALAEKYHKQADNIKRAHEKAKAEKKNMRLQRDGTISEITTTKGQRAAKGALIGIGAAAAAGAVGYYVVYPVVAVGRAICELTLGTIGGLNFIRDSGF